MPGIIRPFTLKDLKSLCHVLENVWDFDDHPRSLRSRLLVLRYALKCLLKSQAAFSAYVEDRFAGAVFLTLKTGRGHVLFLPLLTQLLVLRALITAFLWLTRYSFKYDYAGFYRAAGFKEEVARDVTAVFGPRPEDRIKARFFIFSRKVSP